MKRLFTVVVLCVGCLFQAQGVLKERDLARTLGVLRAELQADYEKQQAFMAMYEQQGTQQHQELVNYMQQCEQISLMLYSQSTDNTFDMAYACQQASNLHKELDNKDSKMNQYDKIIAKLKQEIERYDALIKSLKSMPPVEKKDRDSVVTKSDSIIMEAIDSLASKQDSLSQARDSMEKAGQKPMLMAAPKEEKEDVSREPLFLSGQQLEDRKACLQYAQTLKENLEKFLENLETENTYYKSLHEKVEDLNKFAQSRYKVLQDNIFKNGGSNYFKILAQLPMQLMRAKSAIDSQYRPFEGHDKMYSEWRGATVLFISVFMIFYLALALLISYVVLRWLMPRRWRGPEYKMKRQMLNNVVGIALFACIVMVLRSYAQRNFIQMGTVLIINIAWLLEVIFLSLYIRLQGNQMRHAAIIYTPLMVLSFIVILFRIVLLPNVLVNLVFPPILLGFTIWQIRVAQNHRRYLPMLDMMYTHITTLVIGAACLTAWVGYTLFSVQIMIWWTFQLAAIMSITCIYDLMEMFEKRFMLYRIQPQLKRQIEAGQDVSKEMKHLLREMHEGRYIEKTWFYDLVNRTLVPILAVISVLFSIWWAAQVFEMTSMCEKIFRMYFIDQKDLIRISLERICQIVALWFVFRYLNYGIRSFYRHYRKQMLQGDETMNMTLARNVISILCWGIYFIMAMVLLEVPKSGISIVSAGLATGLGFAMQSILENFFYGISLMTGRVHVGDFIECDGISGKVESITYQSTQIITADGCVISFLNSALFSKNFKNMTRNHRYELIKIPVGVAYGTNVQEVREMLIEAIAPACQEVNAEGHTVSNTKIAPTVAFSNFGDNSVDLLVCVWMLVEEKVALTGRLREIIYNTLNEHNIEIPFPQRDVHIIK